LIYLGLLELPRGVGELLEAAAMCLEAGADIRLSIIGDGRDGDILRRKAIDLGLGEKVRFTGRLDHTKALSMLEAADIGVVPHHADEAWNTTIPNKLFDYMAAGLAVISSDAAPPARVLKETGAGVVFQSGDPRSLRDAILSLLDTPTREAMGRAGQESVRGRFNWERESMALLNALGALAR
jgi:glycosyltransferase involved in cell wall biosynthesis